MNQTLLSISSFFLRSYNVEEALNGENHLRLIRYMNGSCGRHLEIIDHLASYQS